jgi:hypothetical protein
MQLFYLHRSYKTRTTYIMCIRYLVLSPSQYQTFHAISQPQKPFVSAMSCMRHQMMNVGYFVRVRFKIGGREKFFVWYKFSST